MTLEECYRTLDLAPGAPMDEVKKAYRTMAKAWHPDRYTYTSVFRQRCEAKMRKINEAYQVLRERARSAKIPPSAPSPRRAAPRTEPHRSPPPPFTQRRPPPRPEPETEEGPEPAPGPNLPPEAWLEPWRWRKQSRPKRRPFFRWQFPKGEPDYAGLNQVGFCFGISIMAFVAYFFHWDRPSEPGYHEALRIIVSASCVYGAYFALARMYWEYTMLLVMLAVVLNPLLPVDMGPLEWRCFTLLCPVILAYLWLAMRKREAGKGA